MPPREPEPKYRALVAEYEQSLEGEVESRTRVDRVDDRDSVVVARFPTLVFPESILDRHGQREVPSVDHQGSLDEIAVDVVALRGAASFDFESDPLRSVEGVDFVRA